MNHRRPKIEGHICRSVEAVLRELSTLKVASVVSCDLETSGLNFQTDIIYSIGFGALIGDSLDGYCIIVPRELVYDNSVRDTVKEFIRNFPGIISFHNGKFDCKFLWKYFGEEVPITWPQHFADTLLLSYVRDERGGSDEDQSHSGNQSEHGLKTISRLRFNQPDYHFDFNKFYKQPEEERDWSSLYYYHCQDCYWQVRLYFDLIKELDEESPKLRQVHDIILSTGSKSVSHMEYRGILVDSDHLKNLEEKYTDKCSQLEEKCQGFVSRKNGCIKNLNSAAQVVPFLFDTLGLPGERTTEKESLLFLSGKVELDIKEFIETLLEFRTYKKMISNYVHGLLNGRDENGRIHPDTQLHGARTGRMSVRRPAVQTIPVLFGPDIRRAFIASPGFTWVDADESQLELRVIAFLSQDWRLIQAYLEGRDIHREVGATMFKKSADLVTDYERYLAKYVDFGVIYQRTAMAVANGWEMQYAHEKYGIEKWTVEESQYFIDEFLGGFPEMQAWIEKQKKKVGKPPVFAETATGFRRRFPLVTSRTRAEIERQMVNSPIQGTASHITFGALHNIQEEFYTRWPGSAFVLMTVHDSIGSEVRDELVEEAIEVKKRHMEHTDIPGWNVPLRADLKCGPNWADAVEYGGKGKIDTRSVH